ncbi:MAG: tetratricopeptide repeat protein [Actinobacteria bacterium]|nr:tetratricopeptide repeat protein [Actinomycetota bacterium]
MDDVAETIRQLESSVRRYSAERYPVQHATAQFHLGSAFFQVGRYDDAEAALAAAAAGFPPAELPREHGVALNALGALLRETRRAGLAVEVLARAAAAFERAAAGPEQGAATHNLGLARRDAGDLPGAREAFLDALNLFDAAGARAEAAAAARELGACLLTMDEPEDAIGHLRSALELAERAGDTSALGAAANLLGLAHLALDDAERAVDVLLRAVAAHPRALRPGPHAMALANLALAYEAAGQPVRARLAAAQARVVPAADEPVHDQAAAVLERLGSPTGDVLVVLADEPREVWTALLRSEMARWLDLQAAERLAELAAVTRGIADAGERGIALAEAFIDCALELPPDRLDTLVADTVAAAATLPHDTAEALRSRFSRAMIRFHVPQWMRLKSVFETHAGPDSGWG